MTFCLRCNPILKSSACDFQIIQYFSGVHVSLYEGLSAGLSFRRLILTSLRRPVRPWSISRFLFTPWNSSGLLMKKSSNQQHATCNLGHTNDLSIWLPLCVTFFVSSFRRIFAQTNLFYLEWIKKHLVSVLPSPSSVITKSKSSFIILRNLI